MQNPEGHEGVLKVTCEGVANFGSSVVLLMAAPKIPDWDPWWTKPLPGSGGVHLPQGLS